jgi:STE24 endopeptidase
MYLLTLLAFAFVLWLPESLPIRPVVRDPWIILILIAIQQVGLVCGGLLTGVLTIHRLDTDPGDTQKAQHVYARGGLGLRILLIVSFIVLCLGTEWTRSIERFWRLGSVFGAADLAILLPFLAGAVMIWIGLYPGDRAIRQIGLANRLRDGNPVRPLWSLWGYLAFHVRNQLLVVALPMAAVMVLYDAIDFYGRDLRRATGMRWLPEVLLGVTAGAVFLLAPIALRRIWSTVPLPASRLRSALEAVSSRIGLRYREILMWRSDGILVNAAVMGLLPPFRYVLLSDGLLETMEDKEIQAVFGHEAGHVKLRHMEFFVLFALASMCLVGGIVQSTNRLLDVEPWVLDALTFALLVAVWGVGFGWISRRFERQADLFGARCLGPDLADCGGECPVHHPADIGFQKQSATAVCPFAARVFTQALRRIAQLNGIPFREPSWRHSSIHNRVEFLLSLSADARRAEAFDRLLAIVKTALILGTVIGFGGTIYLYWPLW